MNCAWADTESCSNFRDRRGGPRSECIKHLRFGFILQFILQLQNFILQFLHFILHFPAACLRRPHAAQASDFLQISELPLNGSD